MHVRDGIAASQLVFESAVAIAIAAFLGGEMSDLARLQVHRVYEEDEVLGFGAVGTDVLHGARAHFARDERQILEPIPMTINGILNPVVPRDACADAHVDVVAFVGCHVDFPHVRMQDRPVEISQEQQVGAAADVE